MKEYKLGHEHEPEEKVDPLLWVIVILGFYLVVFLLAVILKYVLGMIIGTFYN